MQDQRTIFVCQETPCLSMGSDAVYEALKAEVTRQKLKPEEFCKDLKRLYDTLEIVNSGIPKK